MALSNTEISVANSLETKKNETRIEIKDKLQVSSAILSFGK